MFEDIVTLDLDELKEALKDYEYEEYNDTAYQPVYFEDDVPLLTHVLFPDDDEKKVAKKLIEELKKLTKHYLGTDKIDETIKDKLKYREDLGYYTVGLTDEYEDGPYYKLQLYGTDKNEAVIRLLRKEIERAAYAIARVKGNKARIEYMIDFAKHFDRYVLFKYELINKYFNLPEPYIVYYAIKEMLRIYKECDGGYLDDDDIEYLTDYMNAHLLKNKGGKWQIDDDEIEYKERGKVKILTQGHEKRFG